MIKDRIVQLLETKGIAKEEFYTKIGMTSANFRGKARSTPLNSVAIENILSEIPDVDPIWLLTGKGNMLREQVVSSSDSCQAHPDEHLLSLIKEKDARIEELAQEIGRLKERISMINSNIRANYKGGGNLPTPPIPSRAGAELPTASRNNAESLHE